MSDPLDDFFKIPGRIEEQGSPLPRNKMRPKGLLNLLSGLFASGTIGVGLFFTIIFINPQSSFNPLPPTTLPAQILTVTPSLTLKSGLPPTWTPTITATASPTSTQILTNTPVSTMENTPTPPAELESDTPLGYQNGSPTSEAGLVYTNAGCSWLDIAGQIDEVDGPPVTAQFTELPGVPQFDSALTGFIPTQQFVDKALSPGGGISDIFTPEIQYWEDDILAWSEEYGLDPNLIATVMQIESCGYVNAKSVAGALGLFQVMPQHFKGKEDPYDPETNAYRGLSWLQKTLKSGGSIQMALAGYNAGIARINNPNLEWPSETQRYVDWGLSIYRDTQCGYDYSNALYNWLSRGGSSLCNRAAEEQQDE